MGIQGIETLKNDPDEPYKAELTWASEGVRITIEVDMPVGFEDARAEADRRAKAIMGHFKMLINSK